MTGRNGQSAIDKRDFDAHRRSSVSHEIQEDQPLVRSRPDSSLSAVQYSDNDDGILSDVVDEIVERDRRKMARRVVRICSFVWGVITWYACFYTLWMWMWWLTFEVSAQGVLRLSHSTDRCYLLGCTIPSSASTRYPSPRGSRCISLCRWRGIYVIGTRRPR